MMSHSRSDLGTRPSLLVRVRDPGDSSAWSEFVEIYAPLIHNYCIRRGLQDSDAADVAQESLLQVSKSIRTFEYNRERGRFRDWLGTVTRSQIGRLVRRNRRASVGFEEPEGVLESAQAPTVDPDWAAEFSAHLLKAALKRIKDGFEAKTWEAFELAWLQSLPASQAAQTLGVPIDMIYVSKSRVIKRLRLEILLLAEDVPRLSPIR